MFSKLLTAVSNAVSTKTKSEISQIDEAMAYSNAFREMVMADAAYSNQVGEWFITKGVQLMQQHKDAALNAPNRAAKKKALENAGVEIAHYVAIQEKTRGKSDTTLQALFLCAHTLRMYSLAYDESPAISAAAKEALHRCEGLLISCASMREQNAN
ncbi:hypothetical protein [Aestuariivirga litoralis]|uniref:hypothetical protein n=1 Tax=Aestuariivirga litoralis TaxID=2650924 RepID=UPI0018C549B3|nr:hypothetical protein [Aestuariivirga litoralis]MBG1230891.1 hypothetical protein [Aestuariivirga litoralis]